MSIEKSREEFEAWASSPEFGLRAAHFIKALDGEYANYPTQCYWQVWQASREALVIELPQIVAYEAGYDSLRDNDYASNPDELFDADEVFALHRSIEVQEAIEAAGLKVKP